MKKLIQRAVVAVLGVGSLALAANAAELRFNNPLPETRPETKELMKVAEDVGKNSGGAVTIKMHNGGSLSIKDADVLQVLPKGAVDMSLIWANYVSRDAPALGTLLRWLPFTNGDAWDMTHLLSSLQERGEIFWAVAQVSMVILVEFFIIVM